MRQPLATRLRPFLRRDLRARFVSAIVAVLVLTGLTWLGVSALTKIDSAEAHQLRVELGLESPWAVCGGPRQGACNYDDRQQERVDQRFGYERRLRLVVLDELLARTEIAQAQLDSAQEMLDAMTVDAATGTLQGDTAALRDALGEAIVDLTPAQVEDAGLRRARLMAAFEQAPTEDQARRWGCDDVVDFDGIGWVGACKGADVGHMATQLDVQRSRLRAQIDAERDTLRAVAGQITDLRVRDAAAAAAEATEDRVALVQEIAPQGPESPSEFTHRLDVATWLGVQAHATWLSEGLGEEDALEREAALMNSPASVLVADSMPLVSGGLASMARHHLDDLHALVTDPHAELWHDGWSDPDAAAARIIRPFDRYRSPVDSGTRWRLFGTVAFLLAGVMLVVVGPVVTATTTAREREAGTLPVLRMTGLSAGDLALAMTVGPNVFAIVTGGALLVMAVPILVLTAGFGAVVQPLGLLLALSAATHLTAIGLGDALGQRVNAMVVGGLLGLGVLGPGLIGSMMVVGDMAATGLLLGPLPAVAAGTAELSGVPFGAMTMSGALGDTMLGYTVVAQGLLGGLCLLSWRRRVEQAWSPLFRPLEGAALALVSVGCSALAVLDLSARIRVQDYDTVNLITFVSMAFLMPVLGWLLVSSLVRPARAAAVASAHEVRRAFMRFQLFGLLTAAALSTSYLLVLDQTGLGSEKSEVMFATLAQIILVAETAVATLLWASRRREGRHRVLVLGAVVSLVQLAFAAAVYNLEVEHVAFTQQPGMPWLIGMEASPYWVAMMVLLWAAGLGLVLAALMRERASADAAQQTRSDDDDDEDDDAAHGNRWLH
jgi:hypothetical protein